MWSMFMNRDDLLTVQDRLRRRAEAIGIPESDMGVNVGGGDFWSPSDATIQIEARDFFATGSIAEIAAIIDGANSMEDIVVECQARNLCRPV